MSDIRGINSDAVSAWLDANVDGASGPYEFAFITGGHSNLTYLVTTGDGSKLVLRRPPLGAVLATAHDMAREYRIIAGVGQTTVPVPRALGVCEDESVNEAPFYVMSHVDGAVLHTSEDTEAHLAQGDIRTKLSRNVIDVLATLHATNPDDIGLGDLGRKEAYLDRQLKRWRGQWENSKTRELADMETAYEMLVDAKPDQLYTGIVHGDYRFGNMLIDPAGGTVEAVLDWELCTLGDVLADVGYLLNNWVGKDEESARGATAFPTMDGGFMTREELVARYTDKTGFDLAALSPARVNYYRAFQHWRLAAIVEGVLARYLKGVMADSDGIDTDSYRVQVEEMAAETLRLLREAE